MARTLSAFRHSTQKADSCRFHHEKGNLVWDFLFRFTDTTQRPTREKIKNKKHVKILRTKSLQIDALKYKMAALTDEELKAKTKEFQALLHPINDSAELKAKLDEIEAEFSDDPAYLALIRTELKAKMK